MRRTPRPATAAGALAAAAALLAVGIQTVPAAAKTAPHPSPLRTGGLEAELTPVQRTALLKSASKKTTETADFLGLGAKEKLVVKDVVKDQDGTLHTRYERTYAGRPAGAGRAPNGVAGPPEGSTAQASSKVVMISEAIAVTSWGA